MVSPMRSGVAPVVMPRFEPCGLKPEHISVNDAELGNPRKSAQEPCNSSIHIASTDAPSTVNNECQTRTNIEQHLLSKTLVTEQVVEHIPKMEHIPEQKSARVLQQGALAPHGNEQTDEHVHERHNDYQNEVKQTGLELRLRIPSPGSIDFAKKSSDESEGAFLTSTPTTLTTAGTAAPPISPNFSPSSIIESVQSDESDVAVDEQSGSRTNSTDESQKIDEPKAVLQYVEPRKSINYNKPDDQKTSAQKTSAHHEYISHEQHMDQVHTDHEHTNHARTDNEHAHTDNENVNLEDTGNTGEHEQQNHDFSGHSPPQSPKKGSLQSFLNSDSETSAIIELPAITDLSVISQMPVVTDLPAISQIPAVAGATMESEPKNMCEGHSQDHISSQFQTTNEPETLERSLSGSSTVPGMGSATGSLTNSTIAEHSRIIFRRSSPELIQIPNSEGYFQKVRRGGKLFQCRGFGDCRMCFSRSEHLARHIRKHTGERPFQCRCGRSFSRLDNLRQHVYAVHAGESHNYQTVKQRLPPSLGVRVNQPAPAASSNTNNAAVQGTANSVVSNTLPPLPSSAPTSVSDGQQPPASIPNTASPAPAAAGNAATGNAATGNAATGNAATGNAATGNAATGDAANNNTAPANTAAANTAVGHTAAGITPAATPSTAANTASSDASTPMAEQINVLPPPNNTADISIRRPVGRKESTHANRSAKNDTKRGFIAAKMTIVKSNTNQVIRGIEINAGLNTNTGGFDTLMAGIHVEPRNSPDRCLQNQTELLGSTNVLNLDRDVHLMKRKKGGDSIAARRARRAFRVPMAVKGTEFNEDSPAPVQHVAAGLPAAHPASSVPPVAGTPASLPAGAVAPAISSMPPVSIPSGAVPVPTAVPVPAPAGSVPPHAVQPSAGSPSGPGGMPVAAMAVPGVPPSVIPNGAYPGVPVVSSSGVMPGNAQMYSGAPPNVYPGMYIPNGPIARPPIPTTQPQPPLQHQQPPPLQPQQPQQFLYGHYQPGYPAYPNVGYPYIPNAAPATVPPPAVQFMPPSPKRSPVALSTAQTVTLPTPATTAVTATSPVVPYSLRTPSTAPVTHTHTPVQVVSMAAPVTPPRPGTSAMCAVPPSAGAVAPPVAAMPSMAPQKLGAPASVVQSLPHQASQAAVQPQLAPPPHMYYDATQQLMYMPKPGMPRPAGYSAVNSHMPGSVPSSVPGASYMYPQMVVNPYSQQLVQNPPQ